MNQQGERLGHSPPPSPAPPLPRSSTCRMRHVFSRPHAPRTIYARGFEIPLPPQIKSFQSVAVRTNTPLSNEEADETTIQKTAPRLAVELGGAEGGGTPVRTPI